jgi:Methyltransferase domain
MTKSHIPARLRSLTSIVTFIRQLIIRDAIRREVFYLIKCKAPTHVIYKYNIDRSPPRAALVPEFDVIQRKYYETLGCRKFTSDWFSHNVRYWLSTFQECGLNFNDELSILEIGSWEGRSALFFLTVFPKSTLTCVDPWIPWKVSDELKDVSCLDSGEDSGEDNFDYNVAAYKDRIYKHKSTSGAFFYSNDRIKLFDIIYVDGSHYSADVLVDAVNSFELLRAGGILIFDDYLWRRYPQDLDNPAAAVNAFLNIKKGKYTLLRVSSQLIIQKQ